MTGREAVAWRRAVDSLGTSRLLLGGLTIVFAAAGVALVLGEGIVNDEGLMTHVFARWLTLEPWAVLFFQKVKPMVCVLYALPSLGGATSTLVAHVLVAALAAPMLAAVARRLGLRWPNLPALLLLASPLYLFGAAAGVSNTDGVALSTLVLYLTVARGWHWAAGLVLGCLPWVRSELAPFAGILWLYMALIARNRGFALGALIVPLAYALAGALYHRDLLWPLHYAAALPFPDAHNVILGGSGGLRSLPWVLLLVTPAIGVAAVAPWRRLTPIERALALGAALNLLLISLLPLWGLFNFDSSARYSMQPLPVLALLAARALEPIADPRRAAWRFAVLPLLLLAGLSVTAGFPIALGVLLLAAYVALAVCAWRGAARAAVAALAAIALLGLALPRKELTTPAYYAAALDWLQANAAQVRATTLYTSSQVLPYGIGRRAALDGTAVRFLVAPDVGLELEVLSNPHNGQRAVLERIAAGELFGPSVAARDLTPDSAPPGALFLTRDDPRRPQVLPPEVWDPRLELVARGDGFQVHRLVPAAPARE